MDNKRVLVLKESFDGIAKSVPEMGIYYWMARDLMTFLGYARWENFVEAVNRAKTACNTQGVDASHHFRDVTKTIDLPKGAHREIADVMLSRLSKNIYERGVDDEGFARIRSKGDEVLFGGLRTLQMKERLGVKEYRPLADFLPTLTIAAKNLATEMTNYNVEANDLQGELPITNEHVTNNATVRDMLGARGIVPERLPPAPDIKKLERHVKSQDKRIACDETAVLPKVCE